MKFDINHKENNNIQIEKKQFEHKENFVKRIIPHFNHKVFEYNKISKELNEAEFNNTPTIKWEDAVKENYGVYRKIIQKENCVYFSALNFKNAKKILKRDFGIE